MDTYKIYVDDRKYTKWSIHETTYFQNVDLPINPIEQKLMETPILFTLRYVAEHLCLESLY